MMPYLRAALSSFTWRRVLLTQALGQIVAFIMTLDWGAFGESELLGGHPSLHFVTMSIYVFILVPTAFCAEEAITRGARPLLVYAVLLVLINQLIATSVCAAMLWVYSVIFAFPWPARRWYFTYASGHFSLPASLGLLVFMNRRTVDRMLEGVRSAELRRVKIDQQLVESRLATAEAQIDPQMLFSALAQIKRDFNDSHPDAEKELDELIQTLRTALARTAAVSSEANSS